MIMLLPNGITEFKSVLSRFSLISYENLRLLENAYSNLMIFLFSSRKFIKD